MECGRAVVARRCPMASRCARRHMLKDTCLSPSVTCPFSFKHSLNQFTSHHHYQDLPASVRTHQPPGAPSVAITHHAMPHASIMPPHTSHLVRAHTRSVLYVCARPHKVGAPSHRISALVAPRDAGIFYRAMPSQHAPRPLLSSHAARRRLLVGSSAASRRRQRCRASASSASHPPPPPPPPPPRSYNRSHSIQSRQWH